MLGYHGPGCHWRGEEISHKGEGQQAIFDHQCFGIIYQELELLNGDNDAICLPCQLYHEPVITGGGLFPILKLGGGD